MKDRSPVKKRYFAFFAFSVLYVIYILPFLNNIVFDAIIHFSFAENFVQGHPFRFNQNGETVLASTSPFWTILLIFFFKIAGYKAVLLLKFIIVIVWGGTTYLIYKTAKEIWKFSNILLYSLLLLWMLNVSVLKNSLGGMENILSAFQLILIYYFLCKHSDALKLKNIILLGVLNGWSILTRPDIGVLCLSVTLIYFVKFTFSEGRKRFASAGYFLLIIFCAFIVILPWYYYQYKITGKIISDSSYSRIFSGRWNSIIIVTGTVFLHPYLILTLFTAFLPVTLGVLYYLRYTKSLFFNIRKSGIFYLFDKFYFTSSVVILIAGFILYTFIVGGDQIGRYFIPFYPFLFILGISGLKLIYSDIRLKSTMMSKIFAGLMVIFLLSVNIYDYYRRVISGTEMEANVNEMIHSPEKRKDYTLYFLNGLRYKDTDTIKFALKEVQFRYFIDNRIIVESLDGRTSSKIFKYIDRNGFPDFEKYLLAEKPDIVEVKDWDMMMNSSGMFKNIFNYGKKDNIISVWDRKVSKLALGDTFDWDGNKVSYLMPGLVRIDWKK
jgi:hypothetical protein